MEKLTLEQWQKIYNELYYLRLEFKQKWKRNDFQFETEYKATVNRVREIINKSVCIIRTNEELNNFMFENEDKDYKDYMEATGFWIDSVYFTYIGKILHFIESKLE